MMMIFTFSPGAKSVNLQDLRKILSYKNGAGCLSVEDSCIRSEDRDEESSYHKRIGGIYVNLRQDIYRLLLNKCRF